ncbi:MAG: hypothetical protein O2797_02515 [Bacteroidetes bacterium]|nr:hypothetical protein [Bacteroidota bacterium]
MKTEYTDMCYWPDNPGKRLGYRGLLSLYWVIWKFNRSGRKTGIKTELKITLPV